MAQWKSLKRTSLVKGQSMAWVEMGAQHLEKLLFIHGNPTSSFLWRNIMKPLSVNYHCIAPDLIGMGDSDKLIDSDCDSYSFVQHREYLDDLLDQLLGAGNVTLVIHDWGSALGFDWARRHPDRVDGIVYMEGLVRPLEWDEWNEQSRSVFEGFRSANGESMVLEKNIFVEKVLPGSILRRLSDDEMHEYRRPFSEPGEDRRPTLSWPRQIPLADEPEDVVKIVGDYAMWMQQNSLRKLFINAEPGAILTGAAREFCRQWKNQTEVTVAGSHFIQEDSPELIASAIEQWMASDSTDEKQ